MMASAKMGKRKRRSKFERNAISLIMCIFRMEFFLLIAQVGLSNCGSNWSPFHQENTNSRLQNRLSTHFQHRPLSSDRYAPISRSSKYRSPTQSSTRIRRKLGKPDTRSLEIVDSKISDNKSFNENIEEPNYSAFSGLSSFASFNIIGNRNLPQSQFSCRDRAPGYYADIELDCKVYHLCTRHGGGMTFQCPEKTVFQQRTMVCNHEHMVNCSLSEKYYDTNLRIGQQNANLIDDGIGSNGNVFMQVIVKNALEEDKRVARYPKPQPISSSQKQTDTSNISNSSSSKTKKDFMQLIFNDSLGKQHSEDKINSESFYSALGKFEDSNPSKNLGSSQLSDSLKNKDKTSHKNVYEFSSFSSNPTSKHKADSHFLEVNDLQVKNDPESFKRSIPKLKQKPKIEPPKIEPNPPEIIPHPRGGPDSHDVFKFDFDSQVPRRPSFTFSEPTSLPQNHHLTTFKKNDYSSKDDNFVSKSPNFKSSFENPSNRFKEPIKIKHDNIVWNKYAKPKKPAKTKIQNGKEQGKPSLKTNLSHLKSKVKNYRLPSSHPLRSIIPKSARVVGIQSIKRNKGWLQGVNRRDKPPHIMSVEDFLKMYPNMKNIRGAIPVPISEKKHIRMIELLAAQSKAKNEVGINIAGFKNDYKGIVNNPKRQISHNGIIASQNPSRKNQEQSRTIPTHLTIKKSNFDEMLKELEKLIEERAEKRVIHFQPLKHQLTSFKDSFVTTQEDYISNEINGHGKKIHKEDIRSFSTPTPSVVPIRPRGEGPSVRFTSTTLTPPTGRSTSFSFREKKVETSTLASSTLPSTTSPTPLITNTEFDLSPKLEFGFKPITTKSYFSFATKSPRTKTQDASVPLKVDQLSSPQLQSGSSKMKSNDPFQTEFDTINEITETKDIKFATRYPRLIPSDPNSIYTSSGKKNKHQNRNVFHSSNFKNIDDRGKDNRLNFENKLNSIISSDPFFFTTTTAKPILFSQNDVDSSFSTSGGISSTLFDMRKFFFIPKKTKSKQSTNLVSSSSKKSGQNRRIWRKPPRRTFFPRISL